MKEQILEILELRKENESLKNRNKQLEDFCQEFVYGEENPEYYSTMTDKLSKLEENSKYLKELLSKTLEYCEEVYHEYQIREVKDLINKIKKAVKDEKEDSN